MLRKILLIVAIYCVALNLHAQRVGFISSQMIRERLPDAQIAEQRVQTMVDEWNREITSMEEMEASMQFDVKKNRLVWSDTERIAKEKELLELQMKRQKYAKEKFETGGEFDQIVKEVMKPVEEKIFATVQQVASKEKYDMIWDQSTQPLAYVNFKYDITIKVLKMLGVDVSELEKEQNEKIKADPRNDEDKKNQSQTTRRRSRTAQKPDETTATPEADTIKQDTIKNAAPREIKR